MARHDYSFRPEPEFQEGVFVPSAPVPIDVDNENWGFRDNVDLMKALVRNPIETTGKLSREQGCVQGKLFGQEFFNIADPELIQFIFVKNHKNLKMNRVRQRILVPLIRSGLIAAEGDDWKRMRHLLTPMFTPRHIRTFSEGMRLTIEREFPRSIKDGEEIKLTRTMLDLTYHVLSDALFSGEIDDDKDGQVKDFETVLLNMGKPDPFDILNFPGFLPRLTKVKGKRALARIWSRVGEALKTRQAQQEKDEDLPTDFLTLLLNAGDDEHAPLSHEEIQDQAVTFIGAGHETTSHGLTWMIYLLSQDEGARKKVEAEVDALNIDTVPIDKWADHLPWTIACFEEAMRLYPPAPFISRELTQDLAFKDRNFVEGDNVLLNLWALHRHYELWDNPDGFVPDRFFGENRRKIHKFQYIPFGTGPRVCIGQRFALQEAVIMATLLLRKHQFEYSGDKPPWPRMRITLQAENAMPMRVSPR
ncbi:MAG: cytochrome P450 [Hellea sp.]|nr:cytochrome P450 [Hellea sp.]